MLSSQCDSVVVELNNFYDNIVIKDGKMQGWYSQGKSVENVLFSVKSGNSPGGQGEKHSLKFDSQGIYDLQYFSFYGFNSFEVFLSFDCGSKN